MAKGLTLSNMTHGRGPSDVNIKRTTQASSARSFIDSIGINTHWTYPEAPYGYAYGEVLGLLLDSGIRHNRDEFSERIPELGEKGVKTTLIADLPGHSNGGSRTVRKIRDRIKFINTSGRHITVVEGPNEPDNFWPKHRQVYKGYGYLHGRHGFLKGAVEFQKDLYTAIKSDPATSGLIVIGFALCPLHDPMGQLPNPLAAGELSEYADWGNFHPYPKNNPFNVPYPYAGLDKYYWQGNFPSINIDEYPYALEIYAPPYHPRPMAVTETGYSTYDRGVPEMVQAKYIPRLLCEYFRLGIKRTYLYELVDELKKSGETDPESNYGLVRRDLSPKPAYFALRSLTHLLKDTDDGFTPGSLEYRLSVTDPGGYFRTDFVHHVLLQKSGGDFYLLLWHEISCVDVSVIPRRELTHPDMPVELNVTGSITRAVIYGYDDSWSLTPSEIPVSGNTLRFGVPDRLVVVRLTVATREPQRSV